MPTSISHLGGRARVNEPGRYRKKNNKNLTAQGLPTYVGMPQPLRNLIAKRVKPSQAVAKKKPSIKTIRINETDSLFITSAIIIYNVSKEHTKEKINEIKNNYNTLLKTESHYRDRMFLELITKKLNSGDFEKDKDVFLSNITDEESKELDIIGYNSWVKEYI